MNYWILWQLSPLIFLVTSHCALLRKDSLGVKGPWLGPGRPPLTLTAWTGLETTILTL